MLSERRERIRPLLSIREILSSLPYVVQGSSGVLHNGISKHDMARPIPLESETPPPGANSWELP